MAESSTETKGRLGSVAARGAAVTLVGQVAKFLIQFGGILILARLLTPEAFGLVAMVTAIVGVGEVLRDFGLSSAAIQAKSLTQGQRSNLFWINTSIGGLLAVAFAGSAPLIADLYGDDRLVAVTRVLAITFLVNGLTTQFRAHLSREMRFGQLAIADVVAQSAGLAVGIAMASGGWGYWSIVWQQIVQSALTLVLTAVLSRWAPSLPARGESMGGLMSFGWNLMATQLLQYLSKNIDSVLVGSRYGATDLGYYNRATQIVNGPLNQINVPATTVALPILSRLQDDKPRYDRFILRGQTTLMSVVVAGFLFLASQADAFVEVLLGRNWTASTEIFRLIAIGAAFQGASYATYWVFLSKGLTRSMLRYAVVARTLSISLLLGGALIGVTAVAGAFALGVALTWPLGIFWISRISDAPARQMFTSGLRTLGLYGVSAAVAYWTGSYVNFGGIGQIGAGALAMVAVLVLAAALLPPYRRDLQDIRGVIELVRAKV